MAPMETVIVRVSSRRAADKLRLLVGVDKLAWWWSFEDGNRFAEIPAGLLDEARSITGVTLARPKARLMRCWSFV